MITLTNTFHGTAAAVRPMVTHTDHLGNRFLGLSHRQVLRARRKLCGISRCSCGGQAGERGGRYWVALTNQDPWLAQRNTYGLHDGHSDGISTDDRMMA